MINSVCKSETLPRFISLKAPIHQWFCVVLLGILCLLFPAKGSAQSSNRWLFIFNTSDAMRDRAKGVEGITQDLLTTAMHGNFRSGDTIGIWTYDSELRAEEAPLQTWDPRSADTIARHTLDFLSRHSYQKTAAFGDVLENILRVIKISDTVTVILVSDGTDSVIGTPFDARVAEFYKTNYNAQRKEHMPIVTVFRGEHGTITTNTLSLAPWPVNVPKIPPPTIAKATVQKRSSEPAPLAAPKPVVGPSLVMIGRKAEMVKTIPANLPDFTPGPQEAPAPVVTTPPPVAALAPAPAPAVVVAETSKSLTPPAPAVVAVEPAAVQPVHTNVVAVAEPPKPVEPPAPAIPANNDSRVLARTLNDAHSTAEPAPAVQAVVEPTAPSVSLFSARNIAIVSVGFSVLMCVLLIIVARGARRTTRASLITRSLDRERQ